MQRRRRQPVEEAFPDRLMVPMTTTPLVNLAALTACCRELRGAIGRGAVPAARVLSPCRTRPMPAAVIISPGRSGA